MRRRSWFEATKNSPTSYRPFGMALSHLKIERRKGVKISTHMVFKVNGCSMQGSYCVVRMNMQIEIIATAAELQTPTANRLPTLIDGFIFSAVVKIRTAQ